MAARGEGGRWSRSATLPGCVTLSGAVGPAWPSQPSWAHLRKVGMSRTGTLRVSALTRRFRSSVSKTTSLSKRMGSSAMRDKDWCEAHTFLLCPSPCTHPTLCCLHAVPPPLSAAPQALHSYPAPQLHSLLPAKASQCGSETALHLKGHPLLPLCAGWGMICDLCLQSQGQEGQ